MLAIPLALSGCLHPLYGGASGQLLQQQLRAIRIEPIADRLGHYLGDELAFAFNGSRTSEPPKYRLVITVAERVQTPLVDTISGRATSGTVVVDAHYQLFPIGQEQAITTGTAFTAASYDRSSQRYANIRAARDAEIRDAKSLADQIRIRIASALAALNP